MATVALLLLANLALLALVSRFARNPSSTNSAGHVAPFPDVLPSTAGRLESRLAFIGLNAQGHKEYRASDGSVLILVPPGEYVGSPGTRGLTREMQRRRYLTLDGYLIGKNVVTNVQFRRFIAETGFKPGLHMWETYAQRSGDAYPVVYVSWRAARAYCEWAGHRLPSFAELEKAARGTDGRQFPWGARWDPNRCNNWSTSRKDLVARMAPFSRQRGPDPVGCFPDGASPCGALDMVGNTWQWCSDDRPASGSESEPFDTSAAEIRLLAGGSWDEFEDSKAFSFSHVMTSPAHGSTYSWSFRVARSDVPADRDR